MPVLDWARTDLLHPNPNGSSNLYFDWGEFAYFDIHILKREGAEEEWTKISRGEAKGHLADILRGRDIMAEVNAIKAKATPEFDHDMVDTIVIKTQGFVSGNFKEGDERPVEMFRDLLALYKNVSREQLRDNMKTWLEAIMPICDEYDIDMCVHPDDPPYEILGLPRIVTDEEDIRWFLNAVPNPHNGLTFCAGSLSAGGHNNLTPLAQEFHNRTHFVHLRSCHIFPDGNFTEASHLGGRADIIELTRIFEQEEQSRKKPLPMRVDHGMTMLGDETKGYNAGYSFLGRMFALGQVQGIIATVDRELGIKYQQPGFFD